MKRTQKWVGFLLALVMVASLSAVAVSADFAPDGSNTAYWTVKDGKLIGQNPDGGNESHLKLFALPAGLTDYTVEAEMTLLDPTTGSLYGCVLSNWKSATQYTGAWVRANGTVNFQTRNSSYTTLAAIDPFTGADAGTNVTYKIKLHFHGGSVDLYLNDSTTPSGTGTTNVGEYNGHVAVMIKPGAKVAYDNFKVTNNTTSAVLWQDDFAATTGEWGEKPAETHETVDLETLGWSKDAAYPSALYQMKITDQFGTAGNKSLHIVEESGKGWWCGMVVATADKLAAVNQYVFGCKIALKGGAEKLQFRFNSANTSTCEGDWIGFHNTSTVQNLHYDASAATTASANVSDVTINPGANELAIAFDLNAGTAKVYLNGTLISTRTEGVGTAASDISMIVCGMNAYLDDLKLEAGTYEERGTELWKEDFESYDLSDGGDFATGENVRPAQDYTGKTAGQIIFEDDYNTAVYPEDLYFSAKTIGEFIKANYVISDAIDGTSCARISAPYGTDRFHSVEIVPEDVFKTYPVYTIHMTVKIDPAEGWFGWFTVFYNTASPSNNQNCGFFALRQWAGQPVRIENYGFVNGTSTKATDNISTEPGDVFDLALQIDCNEGTCYAYIDGDFVSFGSGINKTQSALYIVVDQAAGYIDNVKVSAGTYADYVALQEGSDPNQGGEDEPTQTDEQTTTAPTPTQTTAPEPTTTAPGNDTDDAKPKKRGCKSTVGAGTVAVLASVLSLGGVLFKKRKEDR